MQQAACNSVLDGHERNELLVLVHPCEDLFEGVAADEFELSVCEVTVGGYVVEAALDTLYGYAFRHLSFYLLYI